MKEIDNEFYCSAECHKEGKCVLTGISCEYICENYHRKYPTPEQFKKEYGEEWMGAVYVICKNDKCDLGRRVIGSCLWFPSQMTVPKECRNSILICACTPWGKPPDSWRPK